MQIVCPQCAASYLVADAAMGDGRMVRCTGCGNVWLATAADAMATAEAAAQVTMPTTAGMADDSAAAGAIAGGGAETEPGAAPAATASESTDFLSDQAEIISEDGAAVADAPSLVPDQNQAWPGAGSASTGTTIDADPADAEEFVRQRAARRRRQAQRRRRAYRPSWTTVVLALLAIIAGILAFRTQVVRALPQTAALFARIGLPVNLRGLAFHEVTVEKEVTDGVPVLVVQGAVVNETRQLIQVPRLRFSLRDAAGVDVHQWTALPEMPMLGPGDQMPFRTRLASPPANGEDIVVRFFNRQDR